jgi:hypothetical protein
MPRKRNEYNIARHELGWTHERLGKLIGVSERVPYRYASGDVDIPAPSRKLLKLLVLMRLTMSKNKFEEVINQLG